MSSAVLALGEELGKVEWSSDSYAHGILELLIAARIDAFHQRQGIVDKLVNDTDMGTSFLKLIGNTTSDALSASRHKLC